MTHFRLALLTPRYDKNDNIASYLEDTISEFFSQEDAYQSSQPSLLQITNQHSAQNLDLPLDYGDSIAVTEDAEIFIAEPDLNQKKNTFCYTYNEKLVLASNAQKTLTFDLDKNVMIENEWKENPFARLITIGSQLLLIDSFDNEYIFTVKNIKYNFKEINATYNITCDDSFTYQTIRQNSGYTLENDASSDDFIGALDIDEWTSNYVVKDCHLSYNYISLENGIYETKNKEIFTFKDGDNLFNVKRIIKQPYTKIKDKLYFETFPFSCSGSNANAALISLAEQIGLQIKTLEHSIYKKNKRTNRFITYFWFEPQKNDKRLGLTYTPEDSIQSFTLTHAGDSLTTVLNVEGPEYNEEIISLIPNVPNIFLDLFNSEEWKNSGYAPGFFSSYCSGREYSVKMPNNSGVGNMYCDYEGLKYIKLSTKPINETEDVPYLVVDENGNTTIQTEGGHNLFQFPQFFNRVNFRTNENSTAWIEYIGGTTETNIIPQTHNIYLEITTYNYYKEEVYDEDQQAYVETHNDRITYRVYEGDEIPKLKKYSECVLKSDIDESQISALGEGDVTTVLCYFYRDVTADEQDFAEMADRCPWLENKIIDFRYFLDNNIISKDEYNSLMNILENDLRIVNGQLMFYAQAYYSALHKRTQELANLTNSLDLLGANCEASIIEPLINKGVVDTLYIDDFKNLYNDTMSSVTNPIKKIALLDYDDLVTNYLNKYINSQQRFLKNIYNFSNYFYAINSFSEKELYPYTLILNQEWNPSPEELEWDNNTAISTIKWYGFDKTNYKLIDSNFKYYSGFGEDDLDDEELSANYGMPLISIFKKDLQQKYLYDAKDEIVYNNPDNYKKFYIVDEDNLNQSFLIGGDNNPDHNNIKYDADRDFYLIRGKYQIKGLSLSDRILNTSSSQQFYNTFDINNNKDWTRAILSGYFTRISFNNINYKPMQSKNNSADPAIIFNSWKEEKENNTKKYFAFSKPLRLETVESSSPLILSGELYKASLVDLKRTYWDYESAPRDTTYIKQTSYYEPIHSSVSDDVWEIDYHEAYNNLQSFAQKKLLYRSTNIEDKWDDPGNLDTSQALKTDASGDYNIYLKNLPIDNIYVKTNKTTFEDGIIEVINKEGKKDQDFRNSWNKFLSGTDSTSIEERTSNPYGFKTYQPISFVNEQNKNTFFRHVTPNLWKPIVGSCVATFVILPMATVAAAIGAAALIVSHWIWYYNSYSPGTDGYSYHDFYGDSTGKLDLDDNNGMWNKWHTIEEDQNVPYEIFFKTSNSFLEYKTMYDSKTSGSFVYNYQTPTTGDTSLTPLYATLASDTSDRNLAGYWWAYNGSGDYVLIPWVYEALWSKQGITPSIIEKMICSSANKELVGDLYLSNPHFLKPINPYTDTIYKGKIYKLFILNSGIKTDDTSLQNFEDFLSSHSRINSVWYYPIYNQLYPIDLSQVDFETSIFTKLQPGIQTVEEFNYIFDMSQDGRTIRAVIFEEIDYKLISINNLMESFISYSEQITGTETYYDEDGQVVDITKNNDFTIGCITFPLLVDSLIHPKDFKKDATYYLDEKGSKRVYTIYQIKNSKSTRWQYGYLDNATYSWDAFYKQLQKTSIPLLKNEIQLLWTRESESATPEYVIKSINSNFLPVYKEINFDWGVEEEETTATISIDDDILNFTCICDIANKVDLSYLTNGDFWYKYHADLQHQLLQQYAMAVECKLTEYWSSAYTNSKYCEYFIPENWTLIDNYTNNYFANRIVLHNNESTSLNIEFIPTVKLYTDDKNTTVFKRYYYKYLSSTPEPNDLFNAGDQETIHSNLAANPAIQDIFTNLEDISLDNIICTEQGNTSYYYRINGGKTWKDFIRETTTLSLDYFSGLYEMTLIKILKSYEPLPMTEYYRLKKIHDDIWSSQLYQHFGSLILENNYKDTLSTTSQELYNAAVNAFRDYSAPERQYNLTLIDVAQLKGYTGQDLRIGDAIRINADMYYNEYDQIYNSLSQYLFITDINYNLRNVTDISVTVNSIKYQDKLLQKLVKLIK